MNTNTFSKRVTKNDLDRVMMRFFPPTIACGFFQRVKSALVTLESQVRGKEGECDPSNSTSEPN